MKLTAKVTIRSTVDGWYTDHEKDPLLTLEGEARVEVRDANGTGKIPRLLVRIYPEEEVLDCDSDRCCIAQFEIHRADISLLWYPGIVAVGDLREWRVSPGGVVEDDGEKHYVPTPDPKWKPQVVEIRVTPTALTPWEEV